MAIQSRFWKIFDLVLLVVVIAIGIWAAGSYFRSQSSDTGNFSENSSFARVTVLIDPGNGGASEAEITLGGNSSTTVLDALLAAAQIKGLSVETKSYPGMGSLVTRIGETANGRNGAYWQFWVNGAYAEKSADATGVKSGDRIEWKYSSSTP